MEYNNKFVIINAAWGKWYPEGQKRLSNKLDVVGYNGNRLFYCNEYINNIFSLNYPYTIKTAAIQEAINKGYTKLLWLDCSCYPIQHIFKIYSLLINDGFVFQQSGYNLAQTCADSDLAWANINRDEAENINEIWSCVFGFDIETEKGRELWDLMLDGTNKGVCNTSRFHDNQSNDNRFLFARQDQTLISLCLHKLGINKFHNIGDVVAYEDNIHVIKNTNTLFLNKGL